MTDRHSWGRERDGATAGRGLQAKDISQAQPEASGGLWGTSRPPLVLDCRPRR